MQVLLDIVNKPPHLTEDECISFLKEKGYAIIKLPPLQGAVFSKSSELVDYFYSILQLYNPSRKLHYTKSPKKDLKLASDFVKSRMLAGTSKTRAIQECAEIIRCVVSNEELFCFEAPLSSFNCFGTDAMKWVIDKAISIINKENKLVGEKMLNDYTEALIDKQEKESYECIDGRIEELKGLLEEIDNG